MLILRIVRHGVNCDVLDRQQRLAVFQFGNRISKVAVFTLGEVDGPSVFDPVRQLLLLKFGARFETRGDLVDPLIGEVETRQ